MANDHVNIGHSDMPGKEDLLGMDERCEGIANFIRQCATPMTIAITGDWGTGKTTAMQLIQEKLGEEGKTCSIWFNTWQFSVLSDGGKLILDLLSMMLDKIAVLGNIDDGSQKTKKSPKIKKGLEKAYGVLGILEKIGIGVASESVLVNVLDKFIGAANDAINDTADKAKVKEEMQRVKEQLLLTEARKRDTLYITELKETVKELIAEVLKDHEQDRIYVFVDDLDRLNPEIAVGLMEGLKNLADYEGCVFVLAVDQEVVERGLRSKYGNDFDKEKAKKFFDKIIQVPFSLPIHSYDIRKYLRSFLENADDSELEQYEQLLGDFEVQNPRTIKRSFNLLELYDCIERAKGNADGFYQKMDYRRYAVLLLQLESPEDYHSMAVLLQDHRPKENGEYDYEAIYNDFAKLASGTLPDEETGEPDEATGSKYITTVLQAFYPTDEDARLDGYKEIKVLVGIINQIKVTMAPVESELGTIPRMMRVLKDIATVISKAEGVSRDNVEQWDTVLNTDFRHITNDEFNLIAYSGDQRVYLNWKKKSGKWPVLWVYGVGSEEKVFSGIEEDFVPYGQQAEGKYEYSFQSSNKGNRVIINDIRFYKKNGSLYAFLKNCGLHLPF